MKASTPQLGEQPSLCRGCPKSGHLLNFTGLLRQDKKAIKTTLCDQSEELGRQDFFGLLSTRKTASFYLLCCDGEPDHILNNRVAETSLSTV